MNHKHAYYAPKWSRDGACEINFQKSSFFTKLFWGATTCTIHLESHFDAWYACLWFIKYYANNLYVINDVIFEKFQLKDETQIFSLLHFWIRNFMWRHMWCDKAGHIYIVFSDDLFIINSIKSSKLPKTLKLIKPSSMKKWKSSEFDEFY